MDWNKSLRIALTTLAVLLCIYYVGQLRGFFHDIWSVLQAVLFPFLAALVATYVLQPIVELLVLRRVPRPIAILLIYIAFILLCVVAILHAIPVVSRQFTQLAQSMPNLMANLNGWIDEFGRQKQYLPDAVRTGIEAALAQVERNITAYAAGAFTVITNAVGTIFAAFVVPFLVFYMLKDARAIGRGIIHLLPERYRAKVRDLLTGVDETLGRYIRGQLIVMLAVGILTYAGYLVIGMPYALLLALFVGIVDVVPFLGPFIGAAPALLLALSQSPVLALKVLVVNVIVQQCEGNLLGPQIMGKSLSLHPMAIVAALLIGGELGGVLGLIAAVPILAVGKVVWMHLIPAESESRLK